MTFPSADSDALIKQASRRAHSRGGRLGLALAAGEVDEVELGLARDGDGVVDFLGKMGDLGALRRSVLA